MKLHKKYLKKVMINSSQCLKQNSWCSIGICQSAKCKVKKVTCKIPCTQFIFTHLNLALVIIDSMKHMQCCQHLKFALHPILYIHKHNVLLTIQLVGHQLDEKPVKSLYLQAILTRLCMSLMHMNSVFQSCFTSGQEDVDLELKQTSNDQNCFSHLLNETRVFFVLNGLSGQRNITFYNLSLRGSW